MDRRRLVLAVSSAAALSTAATVTPSAAVQAVRSRVPEYVGAMTVMRRNADWVLEETSRLLAAQERDDEEWRIDVLSPFAVVDAIRDTGRTIAPPGKFADAHLSWLDAMDELVAAGLHLRTGVLDDNERSFDLATRAMDRARDVLAEVDAVLPRRVRRTT